MDSPLRDNGFDVRDVLLNLCVATLIGTGGWGSYNGMWGPRKRLIWNIGSLPIAFKDEYLYST